MAIEFCDGEIHIWYFNIKEVSEERLLTYLKESSYSLLIEQFGLAEMDSKFRHNLTSNAIKKIVLSRYLRCYTEDISIEKTSYGKPIVTNHDVNLSVSYSGCYMVISISKKIVVGVDIEDRRRNLNALSIAEKYFTSLEYKSIKNDESNMNELFYDYWTLKEAFVKAIGVGFFKSLKSFGFAIGGKNDISIYTDNGVVLNDWVFYTYKGLENHTISIAANHPSSNIQFKLINSREYFKL